LGHDLFLLYSINRFIKLKSYSAAAEYKPALRVTKIQNSKLFYGLEEGKLKSV
jgi:hypothetical protein